MFAWSWKSKSTSGLRGTDDSVLWIFEIFTLFMFSRSGNPLLIFLQNYHVWVTSKIQIDFRFNTYSKVLVIVFCRFLKFLHYVLEVNESFADIPTELPCLDDLENSGHLPVQEVFEVTQIFVPWQKCSKFISNRAKRRVTVTRPMLYCQLHCHVTSCYVMSCHVSSSHVMSRHGTLCHVMSRHATSIHVMSRHVTSCHVKSRHVTSCHVLTRHITSYHATSCHVMSRPVTSCHVGCPKWCRYHTASAVYNLVFIILKIL